MNVFHLLTERHRRARDSGAVAIIVALVVSTVLLGMAAFAVDFGNAFARRADLQGMADDSARAGAAELPDTAAAQQAALRNLCLQDPKRTGWTYTGCTGSPVSGPTAADGTAAQVTFTDDETSATTAANFIATRITVVVPPSEVQFSFGQALGTPDISLGATATAGIGTPTGVGLLPFFLVPGDFKVDDVPTTGDPTPDNGPYQRGDVNGKFCISTGRSGSFGAPCKANRDLALTNTEQGELSVPRLNQSGNQVTTNIQRGVEPSLRDWSRWPLVGSIRTPTIGNHDECGDSPPTTSASGTTYVEDVSCLRVVRAGGTGNFTEQQGFFGTDGRAFARCRGGISGTIRGVSGVDTTPLLQTGSPLVDDSLGPATGTGSLEEAITTSATAAAPGWIKEQAFTCPQLALLPVLDAELPVSGSARDYPVLGFAYIWLDRVNQNRGGVPSSDHGYYFSLQGRVIGLEGYIIPRWYLPDLVTESPTVGPYLGPGWPKQVVLVK